MPRSTNYSENEARRGMSSYRGRRKDLIFSQLDGSFVGRRAGNGFGEVLFWGVREEHLVTTILEKIKINREKSHWDEFGRFATE